MKVTYDATTDILNIILQEVPVEESDEVKPGVILDYDRLGNVVAMEVLDASRRVKNPKVVEHLVSS